MKNIREPLNFDLEKINGKNLHFKFNGKEYDAETGNYYYGARYMNPKWNIFLTPDPALESYPGISPYAYTLNNPVRYVDPTGMFVEDHDYTIDEDGNIEKVRHIENSTFDRLHTKENWRSGIDDKGIDVQDQNILFSLSEDDQNYTINTFWGKKIGAWSKTSNKIDAYNVFKFASDNSKVEWKLEEYTNNKFLLGNNHFSEAVGAMRNVSGYSIEDLIVEYHSHLGKTINDNVASGYPGDQNVAARIIQNLLDKKIDYSKHPRFFIYMPHLQEKFEYNPWNNRINPSKVNNYKDLY